MKRYRKKKYNVYMKKMAPGIIITNILEGNSYTTSAERPFVITGLAGEQWILSEDKLRKQYCFPSGAPISENITINHMYELESNPSTGFVWAQRSCLEDHSFIYTKSGDALELNRLGVPHGEGDYIVYEDIGGVPDMNDKWVVNGAIFPRIYEDVDEIANYEKMLDYTKRPWYTP